MSEALEATLNKPVWLLTATELDSMPKDMQKIALEHRHFLKKSGALLVILANPPGTKFETVWDRDVGQWRLRPAT